MSEKVVLTAEQQSELKAFKDLGRTLEDWISNKNNPLEPNSKLHQLKLDEMARILYADDYEVENPKFQKGDYIIRKNGEKFESGGRVDEFSYYDEMVSYVVLHTGWRVPAEAVRLASEEEVFWLGELGRDEVGDFRIGDIFVDGKGYSYDISETDERDFDLLVSMAKDWYFEGDITGIYPAESFKPIKKEQTK